MAITGHLHDVSLPTLVQLACQQGQRARLSLRQQDREAVLYLDGENVIHASLGHQLGEEVIQHVLDWDEGDFSLEPVTVLPSPNIERPWSSLLIDRLQIGDERRDTIEIQQTRRDDMSTRTTTDVLKDFLDVPGISTAVVVGRDGFVIEAAGGTRGLGLDALGASLAHAVNGIERMGQELQIKNFQDLFVEYQGSVIISRPVGEAIIALVTPDASQLGIIRHMIKPLVKEMVSYF